MRFLIDPLTHGAARGRLRFSFVVHTALATVAGVLCAVLWAPVLADEIESKAVLCLSCHGDELVPEDPQVPIIAGQEFYYLYVQLKDYKAGRRANPVMKAMVAALSKQEMQSLAQYFADRSWTATGYRTPQGVAGSANRGLVAGQCVQCHLGGYEGNSRVPRLAGQQVEYLERTMGEFKHKVRLNSPAKNSLLKDYEDSTITSMAQFLGGL